MKNPPDRTMYDNAINNLKFGASTLVRAVAALSAHLPEDAANDIRLAMQILEQCTRLEKEGQAK